MPFGLPTLEASSYHREVVSLQVGRKLAHYEILELIGKGGMGEVYRAKDGKLGRDVAIKVLPEEFAGDDQRLARFEREAKLLASLNHPNIASIYGLEEIDGVKALVLKLVEGRTLAERIQEGPISVEEAIAIGRQIAEALEAGHEAGVIHRDLKPANVKIKEDGTVKVLDYGLAKALQGDTRGSADSELSQSPTLTRHGTQLGVILGTAAYMSPEQAKGKRVDKRTDIFAFGAVLFEMLTGRQVFKGEDISETIARVLEREPDWAALPPKTPEAVERLLRRCLHKDPKQRVRDMGDARLELMEPAASSVASPRSLPSMLPWLLFAVSAAAAIWFATNNRSSTALVTRFIATLPEGIRFQDGPQQHVAFSPDGSRIVYAAGDGSSSQLYVLDRSAVTPSPLPRTEGASSPFFSPDGRWIGFFAGGKLQKIAVAGGAPIPICEARRSPGASWGPDDKIIYADSYSGGFLGVSAGGGEPETMTTVSAGETGHRWPQHLPDGDTLLFAIRTDEGARIVVQSLVTGDRKTLLQESVGASQALYLPTGHLLYDQERGLLAALFDTESLALQGAPVSIGEDAYTKQSAGGLSYVAASSAGDLVYLPAAATRTTASIRRLTNDGDWLELTELKGQYNSLALDPDGRRVAVELAGIDGGSEIWLYDTVRSWLVPLARAGRSNSDPIWTPDGLRVTFRSGRGGLPPNPFWVPADGSGDATQLIESGVPHFPLSWTPDGSSLAHSHRGDIWILHMDDGNAEPLITAPGVTLGSARFSPDGRWIAYVSNESGRDEVYVTSYPVPGARVPVSTERGEDPEWSANGRGLYFRSGSRLMRVEVEAGENFVPGTPRLIAEADVLDYDVTPDEHIIAIWPEGSRGWNRLHIVLNWFQELKRLVPTDD